MVCSMSGSEVTGSPSRVIQTGPQNDTKLRRVNHKLKYKTIKKLEKNEVTYLEPKT